MNKYFHDQSKKILYVIKTINCNEITKNKEYLCTAELEIFYEKNPIDPKTHQKTKRNSNNIPRTYHDTKVNSERCIYQDAIRSMGNVQTITEEEYLKLIKIYK